MGRHSLTFSLCWHWAVQESCQENWSLCYTAADLEGAAAEERRDRSRWDPDASLVASTAFGLAVISAVSLTVLRTLVVNISGLIFLTAVSSARAGDRQRSPVLRAGD